MGFDCDPGRRHQRTLFHVLRRRRRHSFKLSRGCKLHSATRPVLVAGTLTEVVIIGIPPEADGKVDKNNLTQFGRALGQLGITLIPAYTPEPRPIGAAFRTHQARLPKELAAARITVMSEANRYLQDVYRPAFNAEFMQSARETGQAFVPYIGYWLAAFGNLVRAV